MADAMLRRPLKSRSNPLIQGLGKALASTGITPNQVSVLSIFVSLAGSIALVLIPSYPAGEFTARTLFFLGAVSIQFRLLCNVLDGLIAVEGGKKSPVGAIYNEVPDRIADVLTLAGLGYSIAGYPLSLEAGWLASVLAVGVAYVRALGGSLGVEQNFCGPMAKPHRMFTATVICLLAAFSPARWWESIVLYGLGVIILGSIITLVRRTAGIGRQLRSL